MYLSKTLLLITLCATSAFAETCTTTNAVSWEKLVAESTSSSTGSGSISDSTVSLESASELLKSAIKLRKRAGGLECTSAESCYSLNTTSLFCMNLQTHDFHDVDMTANLKTGEYELLQDGRKGNFKTGPFPTPTPTMGAGAKSTGGAVVGFGEKKGEWLGLWWWGLVWCFCEVGV